MSKQQRNTTTCTPTAPQSFGIEITSADIARYRAVYVGLTSQQRNIARLMAAGLDLARITKVLGISRKTLDAHLGRMRRENKRTRSCDFILVGLCGIGAVTPFAV